MKHKTLFLLCILVAVIMLASCSTKETKTANVLSESTEESSITEESVVEEVSSVKVPEEIPEIKVTIGDKIVPTIHAPTQWNGAMFKRMPLYNGEYLPVEAIVLESGGSIALDFGEYPPDEIAVTEKVYSYGLSSGHWFSSPDTGNSIVPTKIRESVYEIKPVVVFPLSDSELSIGRQNMNFYSVTVSWGENVCEYGFFVFPT